MQTSIFDIECHTSYKIKKPIRLIELFAGIGSQAKAFSNLKITFEHYRICEFDKYAVQSYNAIHGTNFKTSDITKIHAADLGITDTDKFCYIMTYSFPCQDLSVAGQQNGMTKGSGTRSGLLWEVERLLDECEELPQFLLMENVTQVTGTKNFADFEKWLLKLEKLGYKNTYQNLNAKDYGIPQNRDRCFMVSVLGDYYYDFPKPLCGVNKIRLKDWGCDYALNVGFKNNRKPRYYKDFIPTIRATRYPDEIVLCRNGKESVITDEEIWLFMGFKKTEYEKVKAIGMCKTQKAKQAGNSIVVQVLEAIFRNLF